MARSSVIPIFSDIFPEAGSKQTFVIISQYSPFRRLVVAGAFSPQALTSCSWLEAGLVQDRQRLLGLFRREVLAVIDLPGLSARARLVAVFKTAFSLFKTLPILQFLTGRDYEMLFRTIPAEKLHEHLASDRVFIETLVSRCREAGIPIQARTEEISGLLYALVLTIMHEDDLGPDVFPGTFDLMLELTAAYLLGEVAVRV